MNSHTTKSQLVPYAKSQVQVKTELDLPGHLSFEDYKTIRYGLSGRDQLLCSLLWETGGRISDVLNLRWQDINMGTMTILMYIDKRDVTITIPVGQELISDIKNYKIYVKPNQDDFIFKSDSSLGRLTRQAVDKKVKKWGRPLNLRLHAHMWRHGLAIHLLSNGVNIKAIAARLGHSNVFTTMNSYLVITPEIQRQMIEHVPMR